MAELTQHCKLLYSNKNFYSRVWLFTTPWTTARQASLSITNSRSLSTLMCIELVMPSNHLVLCRSLRLLPSIFPSIRVFSNESSHQVAAAAKSLKSCPTLCDPIDGSPPGSPIPGILQARTLEWVAISFSNAWKWKWKWSRSVVSDSSWPHGLQPTRLLCPWGFPGKSGVPSSFPKNVSRHCQISLWTQIHPQ